MCTHAPRERARAHTDTVSHMDIRVLQPSDAYEVVVPAACGEDGGGAGGDDDRAVGEEECSMVLEIEAVDASGQVPRRMCVEAFLNGQGIMILCDSYVHSR
jgi:hypothetical protein